LEHRLFLVHRLELNTILEHSLARLLFLVHRLQLSPILEHSLERLLFLAHRLEHLLQVGRLLGHRQSPGQWDQLHPRLLAGPCNLRNKCSLSQLQWVRPHKDLDRSPGLRLHPADMRHRDHPAIPGFHLNDQSAAR
jgi:hypothetical protein